MAQEDNTADRTDSTSPTPIVQQPSDPAAWFETTARLAASAGIADVEQLRSALARGLGPVSLFQAGGGTVRTADGRFGLARPEALATGKRVVGLIGQLDQVLLEADWPIGNTPQAAKLRTALDQYAAWVENIEFKLPGGRGRPKSPEIALTFSLANAWPRLTGENPTAWRTGDDSKKRRSGGRFFEFLELACETFGLKPPSPDTVRRALSSIAKT